MSKIHWPPASIDHAPMAGIISRICAYAGVAEKLVKGPLRTPDVVNVRHVAMWACRDLTKKSLTQIGRAFGGRHHTSVLYAVRKANRELDGFHRVSIREVGLGDTAQVRTNEGS